jgi:hypothetical protein
MHDTLKQQKLGITSAGAHDSHGPVGRGRGGELPGSERQGLLESGQHPELKFESFGFKDWSLIRPLSRPLRMAVVKNGQWTRIHHHIFQQICDKKYDVLPKPFQLLTL